MAPGASSATTVDLSANDSRILSQVFDPESAPDAPEVIIDASLPADPNLSGEELVDCKTREVKAIRLIETCTNGNKDSVYHEALDILSRLIREHEIYASAYNNRAQLHRWRFGDGQAIVDKATSTSAARTAIFDAYRDLERCISLTAPSGLKTVISPTQQRLLAQAWTQRAAIVWSIAKEMQKKGLDHLSSFPKGESSQQIEWVSWDQMRIEEEASRCFYQAGIYGSEVGKTMAVAANPYARLCGSIVKEAMRGELSGT